MRYLTEADRIHIADRLREKASVRAIAAELGRSPSTHRKPGDPPQRTLMPNGGSYYTPRPPSAAWTPPHRAPSPAR
ncbi:helix-turn-helix domain-containing protein [Streptomyces sp. NPDC101169]|uniref:helix-turn-helix domain-containing protein n=1 Tax=Streptomyces sp. NPDC101169 TaxID=3366121 RepID=UPI00381A05DE